MEWELDDVTTEETGAKPGGSCVASDGICVENAVVDGEIKAIVASDRMLVGEGSEASIGVGVEVGFEIIDEVAEVQSILSVAVEVSVE